jgi:hypothetical protein
VREIAENPNGVVALYNAVPILDQGVIISLVAANGLLQWSMMERCPKCGSAVK